MSARKPSAEDALTKFVNWLGENTLLETHEGEAVFLHSETCPSFCDYACNEPGGSMVAKECNALLAELREAIAGRPR